MREGVAMVLKKIEKLELQGRKLEKDGKFKKAIEKYHKAIEIIDKHIALYPTERLRKALLYARIGYCYKNLNIASKMISAFQKAAKEAEENAVDDPNIFEQSIIYHILSGAPKDVVKQLLERVLELYQNENNIEKTVDILLRLEKVTDAITLLIDVEKIFEESGDYKNAAKYLNMIAECYIFMEDYVSAAESYEKMYEILTKSGEKEYRTLEQVCKNANKCYLQADMNEKAKFVSLNAIMLYKEEMEDWLAKNRIIPGAKAIMNIAKAYKDLNHEHKYEELWQKGIDLYIQALNEEKDLYKKSLLSFTIAKHYENKEKADDALNYHETGFEFYFKAIKRMKTEEIDLNELCRIIEYLDKLKEKKRKKVKKKVEGILARVWKNLQKTKSFDSKFADDVCKLADCLELLGRRNDAKELYIFGAGIYEKLIYDGDISYLCDSANLAAMDAVLARHLTQAIMNYLSGRYYTGELLNKLGRLLALSEKFPFHIRHLKFLDILRSIIVAIRLKDKEQIKNVKKILDSPIGDLIEVSKTEMNRLNMLLNVLLTELQ